MFSISCAGEKGGGGTIEGYVYEFLPSISNLTFWEAHIQQILAQNESWGTLIS